MMKGFTYVAAIALLTAGTAFAQAQSGAAGANGSTINNSTPTPAAKGPAEGVPRGAGQPGTMMNQSGSQHGFGQQHEPVERHGSLMKSMKSKSRMHHGMSSRSGGNDAKENRRDDAAQSSATRRHRRKQQRHALARHELEQSVQQGLAATGSGGRRELHAGQSELWHGTGKPGDQFLAAAPHLW